MSKFVGCVFTTNRNLRSIENVENISGLRVKKIVFVSLTTWTVKFHILSVSHSPSGVVSSTIFRYFFTSSLCAKGNSSGTFTFIRLLSKKKNPFPFLIVVYFLACGDTMKRREKIKWKEKQMSRIYRLFSRIFYTSSVKHCSGMCRV